MEFNSGNHEGEIQPRNALLDQRTGVSRVGIVSLKQTPQRADRLFSNSLFGQEPSTNFTNQETGEEVLCPKVLNQIGLPSQCDMMGKIQRDKVLVVRNDFDEGKLDRGQ